MSTHSFCQCDRCGKQFEFRKTKCAAIVRAKKLKKFRVIKLYYGNPTGYDYAEYEHELCGECTKKLDKFLKGEEE